MPEQLMALLERVAPLFVVVLAAWLAYTTWQRLIGGRDEDPQMSKTMRSTLGYVGVTLSGVPLIALVVGAIAALTWPLLLESRAFQVLAGLVLAAHVIIERREVTT